jgi:hypothetical protein
MAQPLINFITKGNPGALSIVFQAMEKNQENLTLFHEYVRLTGVSGSEMWVEYKDYQKDIDRYLEHVEFVVNGKL